MHLSIERIQQGRSAWLVAIIGISFLCSVAKADESTLAPPPPDPVDSGIRLGPPATSPSAPQSTPTNTEPPQPADIANPSSAVMNENAWVPVGAAPITNGQVENIPNGEVAGAVHVALPHPTNADVLYIGAVNGGIWKTSNATATSPAWTPLTDFAESLSISALEFDPLDTTYNTLWAAVGRNSSFARFGGARTGLLRTTDGGATWASINGSGILDGKNITGVVARGNTIVISVDIADEFTFPNVGIFRSTDGGTSFSQISRDDGSTNGLPGGTAFDLASHPDDPAVMYTDIRFADLVGGMNGIYRSTDTGATWQLAGSTEMNNLVNSNTSNVEISIHHSTAANVVYVAILNFGQLVGGGVFRSEDAGSSWQKMDNPVTLEVGGSSTGVVGTNPRFKPNAGEPGSQGAIHFSILADPTDPEVVYIGGDRQPRGLNDTGTFPNSIGARDFSGRLFRGDAGISPINDPDVAPSPQWKHMTHVQDAGGMIGGGTASASAPHADSRSMAFDALGNLIQSDDGGVYKRTSPQDNTGDWFSLNGNLQISEMHDIAYDTLGNIYLSGNQDTGTPEQASTGDSIWFSVSTGDGGDVAVDRGDLPGESVRYSSFQNLGGFTYRVFDESNNLLFRVFPVLRPVGNTPSFIPTFKTAIAVNDSVPGRLILLGVNGVFESLDRGDTISLVPADSQANISLFQSAIAYGNLSNDDALYVGRGGVLMRRANAGQSLTTVLNISVVNDVVMGPLDWQSVWVAGDINGAATILHSTDGGSNWLDITGDYSDRDARSVVRAPCDDSGTPCVYVAGATSVYQRPIDLSQGWTEISNDLPNAPVFDLTYDVEDNLLIAATMGRGAWVQQLNDQLVAMSQSLGGVAYDPGNTRNGAALGTLTVDFDVLYQEASGGALQNLYAQVTRASGSFLQNPDGPAPGRVFSTVSIPNSNLPGGDSFAPGETLTIPFEIGIVSAPWALNFRLYGEEVTNTRSRSGIEKKLLTSFRIDSSMLPAGNEPILAAAHADSMAYTSESPSFAPSSNFTSRGCTISSSKRGTDPLFALMIGLSLVVYLWRGRPMHKSKTR